MTWLFAILVVVLMGAIAVVAAGRGAPLAPEYDDRPDVTLPASGPVAAEELRRVRFSLALRGYRMSEVDALLDRLATQLEETQRDTQRDTRREAGRARGTASGAEDAPGDAPGRDAESRGDGPTA